MKKYILVSWRELRFEIDELNKKFPIPYKIAVCDFEEIINIIDKNHKYTDYNFVSPLGIGMELFLLFKLKA